MTVTETMTGNIETNSVGVDNSRVIRAFGQDGHVLASSQQTDEAETALNQSASTIDDDHSSGAEAFAHEIEIGFRKIFRLTDAANGQRLAGCFE
jgi:hypothetical protein